jgi:transposase-like protein
MREYSKEFKASIIAKMLPPNNVSVPRLTAETGIPKDTLYTWRSKHRKSHGDLPAPLVSAGELSSEEKFAEVIESASLNELELSEYCRRKGLYPEQIQAWRKTCLQANAPLAPKVDLIQIRAQAKQIKQLESELRRKDKALAETAAILVLQKKVQAIWGEPEDEKSSYGCDKK